MHVVVKGGAKASKRVAIRQIPPAATAMPRVSARNNLERLLLQRGRHGNAELIRERANSDSQQLQSKTLL